jgi:hypothetical protein
VKKQIRNVNQPAGLLTDCLLYGRVPVAKRVYANAAQEVQIALPILIPEINTFPAREKNAVAVVGGKQELGFCSCHGRQIHATITSVPQSTRVR